MAPDLFASDGGIARIMRLYLKAACELATEGDKVSFISLTDQAVDTAQLRKYTNGRLADYQLCNRSKRDFIRGGLKMGGGADRIICGHVAQLPVAWASSLLRRRQRYYLVAHGIEVWEPFSIVAKRAIRGAERIFCVSDYTRQRLLELCPVREGRAVVLHNALDPYFEVSATPMPRTDRPVILAVTRLSKAESYKGISHLIEAMPRIVAEVPGATLRIVGRGDDLASLQSRAHRLSLNNVVKFLGYCADEELRNEFSKCSLFALPSEKEGFGLVYIEAMANGRPCIGARSGGAPEIITEDTGYLVNYGAVEEIGSAVVAGLRREWSLPAIVSRAAEFSYLRFKQRLGSLFS